MAPVYQISTKSNSVKKLDMDFYRKELLQDIKDIAFDVGNTFPEESEKRKLIQDIAQGNIDRVTRVMNREVKRCELNLYSLTNYTGTSGNEEHSDLLKEVEIYRISINVSIKSKPVLIEHLVNCIHDYVVYRVLAEYFLFTIPELAQIFLKKYEDLYSDIRQTIVGLMPPLRIQQHPF